MSKLDTTLLSKQLLRFAETSCRGQSPLYERLCIAASQDSEVMKLAAATPSGQPVPNLLLAAVHYLLLDQFDHALAAYYPSCGGNGDVGDSFPAFRDFCVENERSIRQLMETRRVQTNEVRRCSYILPAMHVMSDLVDKPLALIEVGCSAGLLLHFDAYAYDYGEDSILGASRSEVRIESEWKGDVRPLQPKEESPLPPSPLSPSPRWGERIGIDLHPIDLDQPDEAKWLRALIWPDQPRRLALIDRAIEHWQQAPRPPLIQGDAMSVLPDVLENVASTAVPVVMHCHTLNQFTDQQREMFEKMLATCSEKRPVVELSAEWIRTPTTELWMTRWENGGGERCWLANVDHHGRWVQWRADDAQFSTGG